jgi:hypothetical protein
MACFPFGHPYRNSEYAQRDLGFNLTEYGYLRFREQIDPVSIARRQTPFVLAERTGDSFSGTVAVLRYRYPAASSSRRHAGRVPNVEPFWRSPYLSKKVLQ